MCLHESFVIYSCALPWDFGIERSQSASDFRYFGSLLECKKCKLRRLYHKAVTKFLARASDLPSSHFLKDLQFPNNFHSITRLINVIRDVELRIRRSNTPEKQKQLRKLICEGHAKEVFGYVLYIADPDIDEPTKDHVKLPSKYTKRVCQIFPEGCSLLDSGVTIDTDASQPILNPVDILMRNSEMKSERARLANLRWSVMYSEVSVNRCQSTPSRDKKVHFPEGNPVTETRFLPPNLYRNHFEYNFMTEFYDKFYD